MNRWVLAALAAAGALTTSTTALAHQTVTSNGARVTLHVDPNDEPEAGRSTSIRVLKVAVPRGARFRYSSCGCRLKVSDSSGSVLLNRAMTTRTTFRFPSTGAYRLTYSGSYRKSGKRKRFAASFAIRAY